MRLFEPDRSFAYATVCTRCWQREGWNEAPTPPQLRRPCACGGTLRVYRRPGGTVGTPPPFPEARQAGLPDDLLPTGDGRLREWGA